MATSVIDFQSTYPASADSFTLTFAAGLPAAIGDVVVVFVSGSESGSPLDNAAATMTGAATGTFVKQKYVGGGSLSPPSLNMSCLTAVVTGAGQVIAGVTVTGEDLGGGGWIVRGLSSGTANAVDGTSNSTADPLTVALSPTGTTSLFCYWANESTGHDEFSAFQESAATDAHNTSHYHALGHILDVAAGSYNPGADLTAGSVFNGVICIYLPNAGAAPTISAQPTDKTGYTGGTVAFTVTASGTGTLHYQWYKNSVAVGSDSSTYTTATLTLADTGARVWVVVTGGTSRVESNHVGLTVLLMSDAIQAAQRNAFQTGIAGGPLRDRSAARYLQGELSGALLAGPMKVRQEAFQHNAFQPNAFQEGWILPGGGGVFTLDCATGTYSLTGKASGVLAGRVINAATGAYLETGKDVGTVYGRVLNAATGAYLLTGKASGVLAGRAINAATGAYNLAGKAAGVLAGKALNAGTGAYALSGKDAGVLAARALNAATGLYQLSGKAAGVLAAKLLSASPGAYLVTGKDATIVGGFVLVAGTGTYLVTGIDANLVKSGGAVAFDLDCQPGTFLLSGKAAGLLADRILSGDVGLYDINGIAAGVCAGRTLGVDAGSYAIAGANAWAKLEVEMLVGLTMQEVRDAMTLDPTLAPTANSIDTQIFDVPSATLAAATATPIAANVEKVLGTQIKVGSTDTSSIGY